MKIRLLTLLCALSLGSAWITTGAPVRGADEISSTPLITAQLDQGALPAPPAFLRLVRITLDPGAESPAHTHPGPEFGRIEAGTIAVTVNGPASIKQRSAKEKDPFEPIESGKPITLDKGDQIIYPTGTTITFKNNGDDQAEVLALVILPASDGHPDLITYTEATPTDESFAGVNSEILGDAIMTTIPGGNATVTLDRIQLKAGQSLPGSINPVLFSVESGDCQFTITGGQVQISRMHDPGADTSPTTDETIKLKNGDAMFFPNGLRTTSRGDNSAELDLLRVTVAPAAGSTEVLSQDGMGSIRFKVVEATATAGDDGSNGSGDFSVGSSVYVNSVDVNLRDSPSLNGNQVTVLIYGQEMTIDAAPVEADGVTWYQVHVTADASVAGYVSADFLQTDPVQ